MRAITNREGLRDWLTHTPWVDTPSVFTRVIEWWHRTFDVLWVR